LIDASFFAIDDAIAFRFGFFAFACLIIFCRRVSLLSLCFYATIIAADTLSFIDYLLIDALLLRHFFSAITLLLMLISPLFADKMADISDAFRLSVFRQPAFD